MTKDDLPAGWAEATLGDISSLIRGVTYKKLDISDAPAVDRVALLRATNILDSELDMNNVLWVLSERVETSQFLRLGDLLLVASSGSINSVGRCATVRQDGEYTFGAFCGVVRSAASSVLPEFLSYLCQSPAVRMRWSALARGTNINNLKRDHITETPLALPPTDEQRRIVEELDRRLSHVDAAAAGLGAAAALLTGTRRSILNAAASGALISLDSSGWTTSATGDVAEVKGGLTKSPKRKPVQNKRPFLRVANVGRGQLDLTEMHEIEVFNDEVSTYALHLGDLLVVEGNGSVDQIGRAASWDGSIPECMHQNHLIRVRPGPTLNPEFLALVWNAPSTIEKLKAVASSTSGLHTLSTGKVKSVVLRIPDLATQALLVGEAQRRLSLVDAAEQSVSASIRKARDLRRSLLGAAFNGKLVSQGATDEPAQLLLKRIAAERDEANSNPKSARKPRAKKSKEISA